MYVLHSMCDLIPCQISCGMSTQSIMYILARHTSTKSELGGQDFNRETCRGCTQRRTWNTRNLTLKYVSRAKNQHISKMVPTLHAKCLLLKKNNVLIFRSMFHWNLFLEGRTDNIHGEGQLIYGVLHELYSEFIMALVHDDVIKWKHFPRYWPFVRGIHRSPVNSPHKGQWRGALMFSLICAWINDWVNNGEAGDLRRRLANYDVIVMRDISPIYTLWGYFSGTGPVMKLP